VAACAFAVSPLQGQRLYRLEVSAAGGYHHFDAASEIQGGFGPTLRVGFWVWGPLSLEAEGSIVPTHTSTSLHRSLRVSQAGASALVNLALGYHASLFLKGGFAWLDYGSCPTNVSIPGYGLCGSTSAAQGGFGIRAGLTPTFFFRSEGLANYSRQAGEPFLNLGVQAGFSLMVASRPLADSDGDGVYDRSDRCAGTPRGALVDRRGCPTDQDADGVPDGLDRCPNTPEGAAVDPVGCTSDTDADGVLDGFDRCPNTPRGALVQPDGCPLDTDQDGVLDGLDRCPATPAGARVDPAGCPLDEDGDGVPDGLDRCPGTRPGTAVDPEGCPAPAPEPAVLEQVFVVPGAAFPYRGFTLGPAALPVLDSVLAVMRADPGATAEVLGYAHDRLVPADNTRLSQRRAETVREYILSGGIPASRVTAVGLGSSTLLVADTTDAARTANRRAEIRIRRSAP
jgi:outer membrane protein OmpA-like peptidoglycan-associated protein